MSGELMSRLSMGVSYMFVGHFRWSFDCIIDSSLCVRTLSASLSRARGAARACYGTKIKTRSESPAQLKLDVELEDPGLRTTRKQHNPGQPALPFWSSVVKR